MSTIVYPNVAFIGRAGSGKTTCAEMLVKHYGYKRMSFAEPLKVMCGTTTDRELLQHVGVIVRDLTDDAGWVRLMARALDDRSADAAPVVIDDCRFPNEAQMLLEYGFRIVRVQAGRNQRVARLQANGKLQDEAQLEHVSETALDDFEAQYGIYNSTTPEALAAEVDRVLRREAW